MSNTYVEITPENIDKVVLALELPLHQEIGNRLRDVNHSVDLEMIAEAVLRGLNK